MNTNKLWKIPCISEFQLDNRLKIFVLEDNRFPLLFFNFIFSSGDPLKYDEWRISQYFFSKLAQERFWSNPRISSYVASIGGEISTFSHHDYCMIFGYCLTFYVHKLFDLLKEIVCDSDFSKSEIEKLRSSELLKGIRFKEEDDSKIIRALYKRIFPLSVYGESGFSEKEILNINQKRIEEFCNLYCVPNNSKLFLMGDTSLTEIQDVCSKVFRDWKCNEIHTSYNVEFDKKISNLLLLRNLKLSLKEIVFGNKTINRYSNEFLALMLGCKIVEQNFRFNYQNYSTVKKIYPETVNLESFKYAGIAYIHCSTDLEDDKEVIKEFENQLLEITEQPVSKENIQKARNALVTEYLLKFNNPENILFEVAENEIFGGTLDHPTNFNRKLDNINSHYLQDILIKYFNPAYTKPIEFE